MWASTASWWNFTYGTVSPWVSRLHVWASVTPLWATRHHSFFDADPDPSYIKVRRICNHWSTDPPRHLCKPPRLSFETSRTGSSWVSRLHGEPPWLRCGQVHSSFGADPDPAFECDQDPDQAFHFHADPDPLTKMMRIQIRNLVLNPYTRYSANSLKSFNSVLVAVRHHIVSDPDPDPISKSVSVSVQHPVVCWLFLIHLITSSWMFDCKQRVILSGCGGEWIMF